MRFAAALAVLSFVACGTRGEEIRDAGADVSDASGPAFYDAHPGPIESDASVPAGIDCAPGTVRVDTLAAPLLEGPFVDAGYVYWIATDSDDTQGYWWTELSGPIMRADKTTFAAASIGTTSATRRLAPVLALDTDWLFWVEKVGDASTMTRVVRGSKDGTWTVDLPLPELAVGAVRVADGRLFFVDVGTTTRIFSAAFDGSDARLVVDTGVAGSVAYAVGSTQLFYAAAGQSPKRVPVAGGMSEDLVLPPSSMNVSSLEVGNDGFVYAVLESGGLVRVPTDGGTPVVLAPAEGGSRLTLDGDHVYYSTSAGVFRSRTDGTSTIALGPGPALDAIAVDTTTVRWATSAGMFAWCNRRRRQLADRPLRRLALAVSSE